MKTELVVIQDLNGAHWRLSLDEDLDSEHPIVVLEVLYREQGDDWVHVTHVSSVPKDVGLEWSGKGVIKLDARLARSKLVALMAEHGAAPKPADINEGVLGMATLPGVDTPVVEEPLPEGFMRMQLLVFLVAIEAISGDAPLVSAMVRKLREGFYLAQELHKASLAARGEIDHLTAPAHRTEEYAARIDMFDRWLRKLGDDCVAFAHIQVPAGKLARPLSREDAIALAKKSRDIGVKRDGDSAHTHSVPSWVVDAIVEASR